MEQRKTWVDNLKKPTSGYTDHKTKHPGLKVRVFSSGRRVWFIRGRLDGDKGPRIGTHGKYKGKQVQSSPKFISLGEYPYVKEQDAVLAAATARNQLHRGIDPIQQRNEQSSANKVAGLTFGQLADEYLAKGAANLRPTTKKVRESALNGKWFTDWRERPLAWIIQGQVNALINRLPESASYTPLNALRGVLNYAKANKYITEVPKFKVARPEGDAMPFLDYTEGDEQKINLAELAVVLDALDTIEQQNPLSQWPTIWRFAALTGARPTAYLGARWEEFDLSSEPVWHLSTNRSKLKRSIDIPLSEAAAALLRALPRKEAGLIWPGRDSDTPREALPRNQQGLITGMLAARGYKEGFWPGRFRDTVMTWLEAQKAQGHASERAIALLVDHKAPSERTIRGKHYVKTMAERLARKLANEWTAAIDKARQDARKAGPAVVGLKRRATA